MAFEQRLGGPSAAGNHSREDVEYMSGHVGAKNIKPRQNMKPLVVYYSKTGNTKKVAEAMAQSLQTEALPLNLPKKGRRNKVELAREKALWAKCVNQVLDAELVFVGTPTESRRPHPAVVK